MPLQHVMFDMYGIKFFSVSANTKKYEDDGALSIAESAFSSFLLSRDAS